jgi:general secretion pathway protein D
LVQKIVDKIDMIPDQVVIETVIVEANLDKATKLGVEWNFAQGKGFIGNGTTGAGSQTFGLQNASPPLTGFNYTLTGTAYSAFLNTLQTDTRFKVLDTPKIFTSNNVKAEINVSTKVPYISQQQTAVLGGLLSNYDFLTVGVVLDVTPRVTSNGMVAMDVVQSADDLQGYTSFNAPIVNHRQTQTTVSVKNGDTVILGGIIQHTKNLTENKIPILGDIPLIGNLFKSSSVDNGETELMILLTPHIVRNAAEAHRLTKEATDELSKGSKNDLEHVIKPSK